MAVMDSERWGQFGRSRARCLWIWASLHALAFFPQREDIVSFKLQLRHMASLMFDDVEMHILIII